MNEYTTNYHISNGKRMFLKKKINYFYNQQKVLCWSATVYIKGNIQINWMLELIYSLSFII